MCCKPLMAAQLVFRQKGDTHCPYHPGRKVEFQCVDCDGTLICALCMTSEQHKRHVFKELKDGLADKVRNIETFIENKEHEKIPEIDRHINLIDDKILENQSAHDSLLKNVTLHGERLKDEVDLQTGQHVSVLDKRKQENDDIYTTHRKRHINFKQQLQKENEVNRKTCKSGTEIQVIDTETEISCKSVNIPETPEINRSKFEPCSNIQSIIQQAFGVVSSSETGTHLKERSGVASSLKIAGKTAPKKVEKGSSSRTENTTNTSETRKSKTTRTSSLSGDSATEGASKQLNSCKLLDKPKLLSQFKGPFEPWSLCPVSDNDTWILKKEAHGSEDFYLVDHNGHVKRELKCTQKMWDLVIHPHTGELYGCCEADKLIVKIDTTNGSTREVFKTKKDPQCITITSTGNFVIGMVRKVCVYTPTGTVLYSYDAQGVPRHISISNDDRQVAVAFSRGGVVVLDDKLHDMYEYKGRDVKQSGEKRGEFGTYAAMFDAYTHLLVDDFQNNEIHLSDGRTGVLLRTMTVNGMAGPRCLGLRHNGDLLVGCYNGKIQCIRYVQ